MKEDVCSDYECKITKYGRQKDVSYIKAVVDASYSFWISKNIFVLEAVIILICVLNALEKKVWLVK